MSHKKRTPPHEWIQDYYSPLMSVFATQDAETIANKNNLTFTELLQPFSKLTCDVTLKDAEGVNHNVPSLHVILQDYRKDPQKTVNQKLLLERISEENCEDSDMVTKHFGKESLDAPGFTPWFDLWMKLQLQTLPTVETEYLKHHFGCIFVVSTQNSDPVEQFRSLSQIQHRNQHEKPGTYPQFFFPNILKYYILVHDIQSGMREEDARQLFKQVETAFDSSLCFFLPLNSAENPASGEIPPTSENWFTFTHRFFGIETRRAKSYTAPNNFYNNSSNAIINKEVAPSPGIPDHPLAVQKIPDSPLPQQTVGSLTQATPSSVAQHLTTVDTDNIRNLMRELTLKAIIPYVEKQLKLLNEIVTNRKSRSLFSGAKRWFGTNKNSTAGTNSVVYGKEAPELQVRKIADLYFLMKLYKPAYNYYYIAKKDFQNDEAWPYYATAVELAALAMFMLANSDQGKKYRSDYMEDAIIKYLTLCQSPEFAVRATLFDCLCLKNQGMFLEAAKSYFRMTNELSDLRSAMLLEQTAYCYLLSNPPNVRKYGFHVVLAGYRFTKTGGCKRHAARLYTQGAQVYDGKDWLLSSEHILYTLGHQKFMLKDYLAAAEFFNDLMSVSSGKNHVQEMVHLREYFLVHHGRYKEDKTGMVLTVPRILAQEIQIDLSINKSSTLNLPWQPIERAIRETVSSQEIFVMSKTCQQHFSHSTDNHLKPQGVLGETIYIKVPVQNIFNTPLAIMKPQLLWKFTSPTGDTVTNDKSTEDMTSYVSSQSADSLVIDKNSTMHIEFELKVHQSGSLHIIGLDYSLKAVFPDKEPTDHDIRGKQYFQISGPRMNTIKDHKIRVTTGVDHRLIIDVKPAQPLLAVKFNPPETLLAGEIKCIDLEVTNRGPVEMSQLHLVSTRSGLLSVGNRDTGAQSPAAIFHFPLVERNQPPLSIFNQDGSISQTKLDVMPLLKKGKSKLMPGASDKFSIWMRGPESEEELHHDLFFYYENPKSEDAKFCYRILHTRFKTRGLSSLNIEAVTRPCLFQNESDRSSDIHVSVRNVCKDLNINFNSITLTQLSLVSDKSELIGLETSVTGSAVTRQEINTLCFKSTIKDSNPCCDEAKNLPTNQNKLLEGGQYHFSSFTKVSHKGHTVHSSPLLDFLKPYFLFNVGRPTNPPFLKGDLIVVSWKTGESRSTHGQTVVPIVAHNKQEIASGNEEAVTKDNANSPLEPLAYPYQPVWVKAEYPSEVSHDFSASPFAGIRVSVKFSPCSTATTTTDNSTAGGVLVNFRVVDGDEKGVRWNGITGGSLWVNSASPGQLDLGVTVSNPGVYHLKNLCYRAASMDSCDFSFFSTSEELFSPIDICFIVSDK